MSISKDQVNKWKYDFENDQHNKYSSDSSNVENLVQRPNFNSVTNNLRLFAIVLWGNHNHLNVH